MLQRERHEAEQAICDCRELVASEEEFEELVQRNVAANASMDYENFAYLLVMVAVSRARALVEEDSVEDLESLMRAYEAKMACAAVRPLVGRIEIYGLCQGQPSPCQLGMMEDMARWERYE